MLNKLFKPWYLNNPCLVVKAFFYYFGIYSRGFVWVKTCFRLPIYCNTEKAIGRAIYKNGVYELPTSELIWRLLKNSPNALFVDVGANIGYYSLLARKRLGNSGTVIAFEPLPEIFEKLTINVQGKRVETNQYAVSSIKGQAKLSIPEGSESNDGISTLQDCANAVDSVIVQTISLDTFLDKEIYILKIDVEGHEYNALLGAKLMLLHGKIKNIIFEDHDIENSDVAKLLNSFGYKILSIGWDREKVILKSLGEPNSSYLNDAPNYIATLDLLNLETLTLSTGWTVLRGI
jgi:FkbM family methyltransferase